MGAEDCQGTTTLREDDVIETQSQTVACVTAQDSADSEEGWPALPADLDLVANVVSYVETILSPVPEEATTITVQSSENDSVEDAESHDMSLPMPNSRERLLSTCGTTISACHH